MPGEIFGPVGALLVLILSRRSFATPEDVLGF